MKSERGRGGGGAQIIPMKCLRERRVLLEGVPDRRTHQRGRWEQRYNRARWKGATEVRNRYDTQQYRPRLPTRQWVPWGTHVLPPPPPPPLPIDTHKKRSRTVNEAEYTKRPKKSQRASTLDPTRTWIGCLVQERDVRTYASTCVEFSSIALWTQPKCVDFS